MNCLDFQKSLCGCIVGVREEQSTENSANHLNGTSNIFSMFNSETKNSVLQKLQYNLLLPFNKLILIKNISINSVGFINFYKIKF